MFHSGTQRLIDAWRALPGASRIPNRADLEPMTLGPLVPHLFSADRRDAGTVLRLAGAWVEALHGRALRGGDWLTLWHADSRPMVSAALAQAFREARPVVLRADAAGLEAPLEVALTPLRSRDGAADRLIGLYQPTTAADRALEGITLLTARLSLGVGPVGRAPLTLAAIDGRRIA